MRISDWSSDVCSSDLRARAGAPGRRRCQGALPMTASLPRLLLTAAVSAGLLFGLAACGKKGAPKPPAGEESQYQYPQHYPAPETVDRKSGGSGKGVSVRVDSGGRRTIKKTNQQ